jgi:hypothetical protein
MIAAGKVALLSAPTNVRRRVRNLISLAFILISAGNPVLQGREEGVAGI